MAETVTKTYSGADLPVEFHDIAANILALVVAAGGKIEIERGVAMNLGGYTLTITEDLVSGAKVYVASKSPSPSEKAET